MNYHNPLQEQPMFNQATTAPYSLGNAAIGAAPDVPESPIFASMSALSNQLDILENSVAELGGRLQSVSLPSAPMAAQNGQAKDVASSRSQLGDALMSFTFRLNHVNQTLTVIKGNLAL